jgi:hypothetical protein
MTRRVLSEALPGRRVAKAFSWHWSETRGFGAKIALLNGLDNDKSPSSRTGGAEMLTLTALPIATYPPLVTCQT